MKLRDQDQQAKALSLSRDRLEFDREKFEFNVARQAILLHVEIAKIVGNRNFEGEDKIRAARDLFFGAPTPNKTSRGHETHSPTGDTSNFEPPTSQLSSNLNPENP